MARDINIRLRCGETTCAEAPGRFCQYLRTRRFGTIWLCHLYDAKLYDDPDTGWLRRCEACLRGELPPESVEHSSED